MRIRTFLVYLPPVLACVYDMWFGPGILLEALSAAVFVSLAPLIGMIALTAVCVLAWLAIRDSFADIKSNRAAGGAWRWRIIALVGVVGVVIDGAVGAWSAYQRHIVFATAVNEIPLSGVPLLLVLMSYPTKQIEDWFSLGGAGSTAIKLARDKTMKFG